MSSSRRRRRHLQGSDENNSESRNETQTYRHEEKTGDRLQREHFLKPDSDKIDLNLLLDAVLDINDKLRTQEQDTASGKLDDDCESVCTSRSLRKQKDDRFLQRKLNQSSSSQSERKNFSFKNDQVFDIDRENQRLLSQIARRRPRSAASTDRKFHKTTQVPVRIKTSSEVNRQRFQRRIEEENQVFLRRLEAVKPTKSLNREHLMRDHTVQQRNRSRPSSASRPASSSGPGRMFMRSRTLSDCHLSTLAHDGVSQKSFSLSSHKSSPRNVPTKPAWEAGW